MKKTIGNGQHVVVIGGGPGGYPAAIKAAQLGATVTLVERREVGGTCLHRGCIPTKFLLKAAKDYHHSCRQGKEREKAAPLFTEMPLLLEQKARVVGDLARGTKTLLQRNGVRVVAGTGVFQDARTLRVLENGEEIKGTAFIIATGSENLWPPIEGRDLPGVLDSDRILGLESVPESLVVIGGGAIGLEFAQMFRRFGTRVALIELLPRILPGEDEEVSQAMTRILASAGIQVHTSCRVQWIRQGDGLLQVSFAGPKGPGEAAGEKVLLAAGRRPCHEGLGLRAIGIEVPAGKPIEVDSFLRTRAPGVYAVGDVVGGLMLAHKATAEGETAACNAVGLEKEMTGAVIPRVVYCDPEAASVGLCEQEARERHGDGLLVGRFPFAANGRAVIEGSTRGFAKVLAEPGQQRLVGGAIVGPQAGHLIGELALAIRMGATLEDVAETVHAHPSLSEVLREAALDARGEAIHIPPRTR